MPASRWFTVESGRQAGPWSLAALHERRRTGLILSETLVWCDAMTDWMPYQSVFPPAGETHPEHSRTQENDIAGARYEGTTDSVSIGDAKVAIAHAPKVDFGGRQNTTPLADPMSDVDGERSRERDSTPHPWHRWFARLLDLYMLALVAGIILGIVGSVPSGDLVWAILSPAFLALVEPFFLSKFGSTPGKKLLNIRVTEPSGARLTLSRAFARSWKTWSVGMGFGIPLVTLFTLANQHSHLKRDGVATYDATLGTRVSHGPIGAGRVLGIIIVGVVMISLVALGASK
jgi:RDD family protein/uncharacterized protein DUF4339